MSNLEGMTCPKCGGQIYFDNNGQEYVFCSHCGTQIFKEDTHFGQRVELEKHRVTANKELESERIEQQVKERETEHKDTIILAILVCISLIVLAILGIHLA